MRGRSLVLPWPRRPQAAALVAQLADPDRGWDAIVIGEYERAFYGSQYALMAPVPGSVSCPAGSRGSVMGVPDRADLHGDQVSCSIFSRRAFSARSRASSAATAAGISVTPTPYERGQDLASRRC